MHDAVAVTGGSDVAAADSETMELDTVIPDTSTTTEDQATNTTELTEGAVNEAEEARRVQEKVKGKQREDSGAVDAEPRTTQKKEKKKRTRRTREEVESVSAYKPILTIKSCQGFIFNQVCRVVLCSLLPLCSHCMYHTGTLCPTLYQGSLFVFVLFFLRSLDPNCLAAIT